MEPYQNKNIYAYKQNGKWGLFDKKGTLVTKIEYDGIGCATNNNNSNNVLIIPDVKGIVVSKIREDENRKKITEYGILNYLGREMIPVTLSTVNCEVENGREKYSMTYQGTTYDVIEYFNQWIDLETLNDENKNINEVNANSNTNTTTTTTTNTTTNNTTTVNTTNTQMTSNQI